MDIIGKIPSIEDYDKYDEEDDEEDDKEDDKEDSLFDLFLFK